MITEYFAIAFKAFASENATVVVGTVLDPEVTDELRVTVVATGIGAERKPDITLVKSGTSNRDDNGMRQMDGTRDDQPGKMVVNADATQVKSDMDYLDIPAFLRKQAD